MEKNRKTEKEYYTIDVFHILRCLWYRAWIILLVGLVTASVGFVYSNFFIDPTYSSAVMLYVNNSSVSLGDTSFKISASDISASQSLVSTYTELLKNRTTLERVIQHSGVPYSYRQLQGMIKAGSVNETEIMQVTVTCGDPNEASKIANTIAEVLPVRISEIIDGATMEVVDSAIPNPQKVAPSITKYTALFMAVGVLVTALIIAVFAVLDDTIHDEEYILQNYDYPILAKIPNLLENNNKKYGYYKNSGTSKKR